MKIEATQNKKQGPTDLVKWDYKRDFFQRDFWPRGKRTNAASHCEARSQAPMAEPHKRVVNTSCSKVKVTNHWENGRISLFLRSVFLKNPYCFVDDFRTNYKLQVEFRPWHYAKLEQPLSSQISGPILHVLDRSVLKWSLKTATLWNFGFDFLPNKL